MSVPFFPKHLKVGFSSSSYQIEGGWDADGKGENVWDRYTHTFKDLIRDGSNGDIAADSYHKYKKDVQLLKDIGAQVYRFSLSWARILPSGFVNKINQSGIDYYNNLINELLAHGIEPIVTLFHWDLPQPLQDLGGWCNGKMANYFADYAQVCFSHFGDRVKKWITLNEPRETVYFGYSGTIFAPALGLDSIASYLAGHTMLKAHANAYHLYNEQFRSEQKGLVGISLGSSWFEPKTDSETDRIAAREFFEFQLGWFAHPIYKGGYPEIFKARVAKQSLARGFRQSQLPEMSEYWSNRIKNTTDFFGLNHYTTFLVEPRKSSLVDDDKSWMHDFGYKLSQAEHWAQTGSSWLKIVPWGFLKLLHFIKNEYGNPIIYITENGVSDKGEIDDQLRIDYLKGYMTEMLNAIQDGVNVQVYCIWSLLDNFEWRSGYTEKFGVIAVDFSDAERPRTPKKSATFLKDILLRRNLT